MSRTHNYPGNRKPRDTSYSKKYKLVEAHGLEEIKKIWKAHGMYKAAEQISCSPYVIRDIAQSNNWKRSAEQVPHLVEAVRSGKKDPSHYKSLDFTNINLTTKKKEEMNKHDKTKKAKDNLKQEFINYARAYDGPFTCLKDMARWMKGLSAFDDVSTKGEFKKVIRDHPDFEDRELYKVDRAYIEFLEYKIIRLKT